MKINRQEIYDKTNGRCGYCGKEIAYKQIQVDHIRPKNHFYHGFKNEFAEKLSKSDRERFTIPDYELNDLRNLLPSCARCNRWKSSLTLEKFRLEIAAQTERLEKYSSQYRMATDFGLIEKTGLSVRFYFEYS